jgi:cellulose synthase/poly-beta-1,6-N-acetylglucosamine synthase-like glycosyltransferase
LVLALPALLVALPALADLLMALKGLVSGRGPAADSGAEQPLIFLVPAHDESLLISRCVTSLLSQDYPRDLLSVVVLADNCSDDTAEQASTAGAQVLVREDAVQRGKGHAIGWALERLPLDRAAAVVVVDADTIVEPGFSRGLMRFAPLEQQALQTFDGASNEFETWLTRLAGLLTRNRYHIALNLKERVRLSCPMTGDGIVLGTGLLREHPWQVVTITEGWELYARLTLAGHRIHYAAPARLYAQEARSLADSGTQRQRWTSGRLAVFRLYWRRILFSGGLSPLQRLDLLAELSSLGPVVRGALGVIGLTVTALATPPGWIALLVAFASGIVQPALYSLISLVRHPEPGPTLVAFTRLPFYAFWRLGVGMKALLAPGRGRWVRTHRRPESSQRPFNQ